MSRRYFTSESVTEGHPDKLCDCVADAILDALLAQDPQSRCACEVTACPGELHIMGEITTSADVNYEEIARETVWEIGYDQEEYGFNAETMKVRVSIHQQSPDIAMGVDQARDAQNSPAQGLGAGDQGIREAAIIEQRRLSGENRRGHSANASPTVPSVDKGVQPAGTSGERPAGAELVIGLAGDRQNRCGGREPPLRIPGNHLVPDRLRDHHSWRSRLLRHSGLF